MRTPPTNWTKIMAQPHETETRLDIAGVSYYGYDGNSGIWSCETRPMLFDKLSVGNCCSATINLVLVNPQTIPTMAKMDLYVRLRPSAPTMLDDTPTALDFTVVKSGKSLLCNYSDSVYVGNDGKVHLYNPQEYRAGGTPGVLDSLKGKYITRFGASSYVYYVDESYETTYIEYAYYYICNMHGYSVHPAVPTDWVRKGIYYIDTREWDAQKEFLTITGYDAMLKTEQNYFTPPVTITGWPKTDAAVVSEISTRIGVELDSRNVLDKGYMVQVPAVSSDGSDSMTLREVLGWVGAMYGGNWCITDEGKLRLVSLVPPPETNNLVTEQGDRITFGGVGILVG